MQRRPFVLSVVLALVAGVLLVSVSSAAGRPSCLVSNERTEFESRSLQAGIDAAAPGDTLVVKGTCVGLSSITKSLTLRGVSNPAFGVATLDGEGLGTVLSISGGASLAIRDLTITNGTGFEGAGIANLFGSTLTLVGSTVAGNISTGKGGGILNHYGTLSIIGSTVSANYAPSGGGIFNYFGQVAVKGSEVSGNGGISGGGLLNSNGATMSLVDSVVDDNWAGEGGGIFNYGDLTLTNTAVTDNIADNGGGGIFSFLTTSTLTMTASTVSGNYGWKGGGIASWYDGSVRIVDSAVRDNRAWFGGGIHYFFGGTTTLVGTSSITGNEAMILGGGVFVDQGGVVVVDYVGVISDNSPDNCYPEGAVANCVN